MRFVSAASMLTLAIASLAVAGCTTARTDGPAPATTAAAGQRKITTQLPTNVRPLQYAISAQTDAPNLRFTGTTLIDIEVLEPTDRITLNAAELDIRSAWIGDMRGRGDAASGTRAKAINLDAAKQTATFVFDKPLVPGRYRLGADYVGKINTQATGLFALDYDSPAGKKRALYTQFQAPDARRFFPGWDEPQFRTPYNLTVTVPADQMAVSNMPQAGVQNRPDGTKTVTFQTTPAMSSYLLFLGVGEFDRITTTAAGTEIGVVTKKGDGEKGRYALEGSARLVPYFNDYFGTRYPLPKLDNVAGPGGSQTFAAMENWGAIFSFESILLVDPAITTEATKQSIFEVAAHEIAHQWFGNLVTMEWWDDIWLNEGFASWMASKATEDLHPEWEPQLGRVGSRETAMTLDSVATTHPVVQHVETVEQIGEAFDAITYQKGQAVITMLEGYVGEDAWRRGVQDYMRTYRLKNTTSDDLWRKIEAAAGQPITAVAHDFTLQPGIPLIRVENGACNAAKTAVALRQGEFSRDRQDKQPLSWRVPVVAATQGGKEARAVVSGGAGNMSVPGCGTLIVNKGQTGYYRTLYAAPLLDKITAGFGRLAPIDQIGLLADNWALGLAGYQPASEALDLIEAVPGDANPQVYGRVSTILLAAYLMNQGDARRQEMVARYASAKLSPVLKRIGWSGGAREPSNIGILRSGLISTLGYMGDADVVREANRRFAANDPSIVAGPLRSTLLSIVARNLDASGWDRLRAQAQAEKNPLVRQQLYLQLAANRDPALARRALELALTPEPGATISSGMISAVSAQHPDMAFDFALQNREKVEALVDASARSRYIPGLGAGSYDQAMIGKLQDYAGRYMTPESRTPVDRAITSITVRRQVREARLPDILRWFEARVR